MQGYRFTELFFFCLQDVGINSIKEKLLVKIAEVPKIETLQVFVNEMDCCIEKQVENMF